MDLAAVIRGGFFGNCCINCAVFVPEPNMCGDVNIHMLPFSDWNTVRHNLLICHVPTVDKKLSVSVAGL